MRWQFVAIGLISSLTGWGCAGGAARDNTSAGYELKKQEGIRYHQQNIQRLITKEPGGDPNR